MTKKTACISIALILLLAASASAEERKYRFEFFGMATLPFDEKFEITHPQSPFPIPGRHEFSLGGGGGVRMGLDGAKYWGQDYLYSYNENSSNIVTSYGRFPIRNRFHQVNTNILFYPWSLERKSVFPYVTAGLGATFVTISQKTIGEAIDPGRGGIGELKSETIFAFNAGGGFRVRLNDRWGVRLDIRDYMSRTLNYGLPKSSDDPNAAVFPVSGVFHHAAASFGVIVHF
jgi:hypothetical protein